MKMNHYFEPTRFETSAYVSLPQIIAAEVMDELDRESGDFSDYKMFRSPDDTILLIRREQGHFYGEFRVKAAARRFPLPLGEAEVIRFSEAPRGALKVLVERFFRSLDFLQVN